MGQTVEQFFLKNGETVKIFVDAFFELDKVEVLRYKYELCEIEEALNERKDFLRGEIETILKNTRKYRFTETGENFMVNEDFLFCEFEYEGNLGQFKRYLKKASLRELELYLTRFKESIYEK